MPLPVPLPRSSLRNNRNSVKLDTDSFENRSISISSSIQGKIIIVTGGKPRRPRWKLGNKTQRQLGKRKNGPTSDGKRRMCLCCFPFLVPWFHSFIDSIVVGSFIHSTTRRRFANLELRVQNKIGNSGEYFLFFVLVLFWLENLISKSISTIIAISFRLNCYSIHGHTNSPRLHFSNSHWFFTNNDLILS